MTPAVSEVFRVVNGAAIPRMRGVLDQVNWPVAIGVALFSLAAPVPLLVAVGRGLILGGVVKALTKPKKAQLRVVR